MLTRSNGTGVLLRFYGCVAACRYLQDHRMVQVCFSIVHFCLQDHRMVQVCIFVKKVSREVLTRPQNSTYKVYLAFRSGMSACC